MITPPYSRRLVLNNPYNINPTQRAGTNIHVSLFLTNMSGVAQTGTARFMVGSRGYAAWNTGFGPYFSRHLYLCTGTDAAGASSGPNGDPVLPRAVTWTLGPNETKRLSYGMAVRSPCTVSPTLIDTEFSPIVEVIVNEDRGAILASMTPQIDGAGNLTTCDGTNMTAERDIPIPNERSGNAMFVNGGRPF